MISTQTIERNEVQYASEMTFKQFIALTNYLKFHNPIEEVLENKYFQKLKLAKGANPKEIKKWIFNAWNTERILRESDSFLSVKENYFALQWSFPQAYYSVFLLTLAFQKLNDSASDTSHNGVMTKFGRFVSENKYPKMISFYAEGTIKNSVFKNIAKHPSNSSLSLDHTSKESCETQICQFLNGTRKDLLKEKRNEKNIAKLFTTGTGKKKKLKTNLNEKDWQCVSDKISKTTLLNLLYRKRIKSNYQSIDSFIYDNYNADYIHRSLIGIVNKINLINEAYIYKTIGSSTYINFFEEYKNGNDIQFLEKRMGILTNNI